MTTMKTGRRGERGFALILALLALMLLTFLGLTLASMTTTELQIATNYRNGQQALYNAEAGLEYGKSLLRNMNWTLLLPAPRTGGSDAGCTSVAPNAAFKCWRAKTTVPALPAQPPPYARPDAHGNPTRNFENSSCDKFGGGMGYGVVLDDGGGFGPYQNVTQLPGAPAINGSFTLWVRRQYFSNPDGSLSDAPSGGDTTLVLSAEGTAPYAGAQSTTQLAQTNRSVRILEAVLSRTLSTPCGTRGGQVGGGPEGSNFSPCDPITGGSLDAITGVDTVAENTAAQ